MLAVFVPLLASADDFGDLPTPARKRVEDDERVTKGLINRLIEGLEGYLDTLRFR